MVDHKERFKRLAKYSLAPPNTLVRKIQEELVRSRWTKGTERELTKRIEHFQAMLTAQMDSGSGGRMSDHLRDFLFEINDRNAKHGIWSLPSSFNVFEGFVEFLPETSYFSLLPEQEYMVNIADYFDYLTAEANANLEESLYSLDEGLIYTIESRSASEELTFQITDSIAYYLEGVSLVRYGYEFNFFVSLGLRDDAYKKEARHIDPSAGKAFEGKDMIKPNPSLQPGSVYLEDDYQQAIALMRIDIKNLTQDSRYILRDEGNNFNVLTDDIACFTDFDGKLSDEYRNTYLHTASQLEVYSEVFEAIRSFVYIFEFINSFCDQLRTERVETEFRRNFKKDGYRRLIRTAQSRDRVYFRNIQVLDTQYKRTGATVTISNPHLTIEKSGYWKRLEPTQIGRDKDGKEIKGKTWVRQILTWTEDLHEKAIHENPIENEKSGFIYVMRNASHDKNIFKIGMTSRNPNIRSNELYGTATPDQFLIANDWWVADRCSAEKLIHEFFNEYRINKKREFFRVEYKLLMTVVDEIVAKVNGR